MSYLPVLKVVLPYIAPVLQAAAPIFTKSEKPAAEASLQDKQIAELQSQVKVNAESLKTLATQLQQAVMAFDEREAGDQGSFAEIKAALQSATEENAALRGALQKCVHDAQITKYIALGALAVAVLAVLPRFMH